MRFAMKCVLCSIIFLNALLTLQIKNNKKEIASIKDYRLPDTLQQRITLLFCKEEDPEEEPEEEEIEDEDMVNDEEDDAEVINTYEEADPYNRSPPTFNEETEFAPHVVQIADADDVPIPPVIQFGSNFHVGEISATRDFFAGNSKVYAPGPMCCNLKSVHMGVMKLSKQMHDRYRTEKNMAKKLRQDELHMNGQEFDIRTLDSAEEPFIYTAPVPRVDDPYVMVRDAAIDTQGDEDVDTDAPWDTQPSEPRGSPRDSQIIPPKRRSQTNPQPTLTQEAVDQLVRDGIKAAIRAERERVATLGHEVANRRPWTEVKQMMTDEFCPTEEVQRLEDELRHFKLRDMNIAAYTERFNELALLCPNAVPNEKKKVELYIKGLPEIIKGETTSSRHATLNEAVRMAHVIMEQKIQAKNERIAEGPKRKWENNNQGNNNNNNSHN
nr:hypothetical protein [Tanacetum cinerariifolium]